MERSLARLPRRDTFMVAILLGVMLAADLAAVAIGVPENVRPALVRGPAALAIMWACYAVSLRIHARRSDGDAHAVRKVAAYLGPLVSLIACVVAVAHLAMLANMLWFQTLSREQFLRSWMTVISVIVIIAFDRAPKALTIAPDSPLAGLRLTRLGAWAGIACGLGMAIAAWIAPLQQIRFYCLGLAVVAAVILHIERFRTRRRSAL